MSDERMKLLEQKVDVMVREFTDVLHSLSDAIQALQSGSSTISAMTAAAIRGLDERLSTLEGTRLLKSSTTTDGGKEL